MDLATFKTCLADMKKTTLLDAKGYQDLFKVIDPRGAGVVDSSSLRYLLTSFHEKLSREDAEQYCKLIGLGTEGSGLISSVAAKIVEIQSDNL
eukprot:Selendium_serpulae@DN8012_c0_g1_i1.p1